MAIISKKGLIGESWILFSLTVFLIIMLSAFFLMIRALMTNSENIQSAEDFSAKYSAKASLMAYLNTPITLQIGGKNVEMKMSKALILSKADNRYQSTIEKESKDIFDRAYENKYRLEISEMPLIGRERYYAAEKIESTRLPFRESSYKINLPENISIELTLIK